MSRLDPSARFAILVALILGIAGPLVGQAQRPLHVLTPEFTALSSLMGLAACAWIGGRIHRDLPEGPDRATEALWRGLAFAALLGAITWATHMAVNQLWHDCKPGAATLYFWLTWPPTAALGCVLGVLGAERGWKTWHLLIGLVALALGSGLHDGLQYLNGVRIIDP